MQINIWNWVIKVVISMCVTKLLSQSPRQHVSVSVHKRSFFHRFGLPSTSIRWPKTHLFKTNLFKTLSSVASLGNVSFSFTRGQKKTQVFDLSDVRSRSIGSWMMSYIIYYACSVRNAIEIPPFNCFPVYGRKRSTCFLWTRVFFFFKTGGIFGYVWTGPESLSKPMLLFKNAQIK